MRNLSVLAALKPLPEQASRVVPHLPLIRTKSLSLYYDDKPAFENISLSIKQGQVTAIIGPSGCGKTSFLQSLNRLTDLIPRCRVTGTVSIGSVQVHHPQTDVIALRRRVGMIFQKPNPFPLSIRKNIELPLREHGMRQPAPLRQAVEGVLQSVGLWDRMKDRLDRPALTLSGGEQQRLCIARALVLEPKILLMDEPCSALDPIASGVVEDLILSLQGKYTIVVVTHNLAQAKRIAENVAMFWVKDGAGCLIENGCCQQVFENPCEKLTASYINGVRG